MSIFFGYGIGVSISKKSYETNLELIELLDKVVNPQNLFDCLYMYYITIFADREY